jgi:hypothetical protein
MGGEPMGIRFFCPNGHKLNVKDFQAGLAGICPYCGEKMPIPLESTRRSSKQQSLQDGGDTVSTLASTTTTKQPAWDTVEPDGALLATTRTGTVPTVPENRVASRDPLLEAGDAVWYVHPPSGGQFGPAAAEVMQEWIVEGRISADSLVWHEGWRNWRTAGNVFPQLSVPPAASDQLPDAPKLAITSLRSNDPPNFRRRPSNIVQIVFVVSLTLAVIILFFILRAMF